MVGLGSGACLRLRLYFFIVLLCEHIVFTECAKTILVVNVAECSGSDVAVFSSGRKFFGEYPFPVSEYPTALVAPVYLECSNNHHHFSPRFYFSICRPIGYATCSSLASCLFYLNVHLSFNNKPDHRRYYCQNNEIKHLINKVFNRLKLNLAYIFVI